LNAFNRRADPNQPAIARSPYKYDGDENNNNISEKPADDFNSFIK